ncbi:MAG: signal transduction histidine kinase [Kiritimatiellia bacterium]
MDAPELPFSYRPSAPLIMGVFSGLVAALAVLPVVLILASIDASNRVEMAGRTAVTVAELHASLRSETATRSLPLELSRLGVEGLYTRQEGEIVVLRGAPPASIEAIFIERCLDAAGWQLPVGGGGLVYACALNSHEQVIAAVRPETLQVEFIGFLMLVLATVVGLVTAFSVLRTLAPLSRVSRALSRVGAGEHNVRVEPTGLAELDELVYRINRTAEKMESRHHAVTERIRQSQRMARMIAHEVRNPLQSVEILASLLAAEEDPVERQETARAIHHEIRTLDQVVTRLLDRSGATDLELQPAVTSLAWLIDHVCTIHAPKGRINGVRLQRGPVCSTQPLLDQALIGRSLENIVLNAMQHAPSPGGLVQISAFDSENGVSLVVDDNGPGVDPSVIGRIFQPNVTRREGGTGLGLALVRAVVEAHGGRVSHEESSLGGARFLMELPLEPIPPDTNT